jgi:hypothetical protein
MERTFDGTASPRAIAGALQPDKQLPARHARKPFSRMRGSRHRWLLYLLIFTGVVVFPLLGFSQTAGMDRRFDRQDDRTRRVQKRDDKMVERRDDPIGVRGPQRRADQREVRTDRKVDRRERLY